MLLKGSLIVWPKIHILPPFYSTSRRSKQFCFPLTSIVFFGYTMQVNGNQKCFQNSSKYLLCSTEETYTGLEQHEDEERMTKLTFLGEVFLSEPSKNGRISFIIYWIMCNLLANIFPFKGWTVHELENYHWKLTTSGHLVSVILCKCELSFRRYRGKKDTL